MSFTHDIEMDYILPVIKPTGRYVEIPIVVIMKFDGNKIAHEHVYWDQASVLAQIGLIDTKSLPIIGIEQAKKLLEISQKNIQTGGKQ
jgi:carboxymethylenebutenolidase